MKKLSFIIRWVLVFGVLAAFSYQSLTIYGVINSDKLSADVLPANWNGQSNLVAITTQGLNGDELTMCAISSSQLTQLTSNYSVNLVTKSFGSKKVSVAEVSVPKAGSKKSVEQIVGKEEAKNCRTSVTSRNFIYQFIIPTLS